jgi:hypothetical protein
MLRERNDPPEEERALPRDSAIGADTSVAPISSPAVCSHIEENRHHGIPQTIALNPQTIALNTVPFTATTQTPFSGPVASFASKDPERDIPGFYTATIDWCDGTKTPGTIVRIAEGSYEITGTHPYTEPGDHTIAITLQDQTD